MKIRWRKASRRTWLALSLIMVALVATGVLGVRNTHANRDFSPPQTNDPHSAKIFSALPGEIIVRFRTAAPEALATLKGDPQFQSFASADGRQMSMSIERLDRGTEMIEGLRLVHV
jgi:hypothetical protein